MTKNPASGAPPLLATLGEPGGIGPELVLQIWHDRKTNGTPPFVFIANERFARARAAILGIDLPTVDWLKIRRSESVEQAFSRALPVIDVGQPLEDRPGAADPANAKATIAAIELAAHMIHKGEGSAMVTLPINKKSLYEAGFTHPGHTEFLGELSKRWPGGPYRPAMMLAGPELRTVPATVHIPLKDVPQALDTQELAGLIRIVADGLRRHFAISDPRLAVTGLNPHAGEEGTMGSEDDAIIRPAIEAARSQGILASGPYPADTLFYREKRASYDAAIAMYHDQALVPVKTIAFDETVNVTLGLPFIRTSPDHGTALDIAGQGIARPGSLLAALKMAYAMAANANPASSSLQATGDD